jgi:hypothetical protein
MDRDISKWFGPFSPGERMVFPWAGVIGTFNCNHVFRHDPSFARIEFRLRYVRLP